MEPVDSGLKELNDLMKRESNKEYDLESTNNYDKSVFDTKIYLK